MNDVMTRQEFAASDYVRNDYEYNTKIGTFEAKLVMKAEAHGKKLRVFLEFDDGRKILAPVYWFNYLGFREIPNGSRVRITYMERTTGVYPGKAEVIW